MMLTQDNFDDALEKNEITVVEFVKTSAKTSDWLNSLKTAPSPFGKPVGYGRIVCKTDASLCEELITKVFCIFFFFFFFFPTSSFFGHL